MRFIVYIILFLLSHSVLSETERYYQDKYCTGKREVVLPDKTRIDCETSNYAIEYDFAKKWAEAIGQSLHYGRLSEKKPGIVLIIESNKDCKYILRAQDNIDYYCLPIRLQTVGIQCPE